METEFILERDLSALVEGQSPGPYDAEWHYSQVRRCTAEADLSGAACRGFQTGQSLEFVTMSESGFGATCSMVEMLPSAPDPDWTEVVPAVQSDEYVESERAHFEEEARRAAAFHARGGPERAALGAALAGRRDAVSACGGSTHAIVSVRVTFVPSGAVAAVSVRGELAGTPIATCIAGVVRQVRVPAFQGPPTSVTYPYRI